LGAVIARTGAGPRGWWDAGRRKELLAAVARADTNDRAAQGARTELLARLAPVAFAPESSSVARDAVHAGRSFLSRLLPRWWRLKAQVAAWFAPVPASGAALRADLAALAAYHQNADAARQVATAYSAELVKDGDRVLWPDTADALHAVDALAAQGANFDALARTDRAAIGTATEALRAALAAFDEGAAALARSFVLPDQSKRSAGESREWLLREAAALDREASGLDALAALLAPGRDVPAPRVREAAVTVAKLTVVAATVRRLEEGQPADAKVRAEHAALGTQLLAYLDRWTRAVTPQLGEALSDKPARERVGAAIKHSETARGGALASAWEHVAKVLFAPDGDVSVGVVLNTLPLADLARWSADRAADADRVFEWVRFVHTERDANAVGVGAVLDEVRAGEFPPEDAADAYRARFLRLWLDALHTQVPVLGTFTTEGHERLVSRFADLDRAAVRSAAHRVRAGLLNKPDRPRTREGAPDASELGVLLREVNKKRRHLPLRHLFGKIPTLLPRLKPCLMMSPLAVSTFLDSAEFAFDLVIFDEASQVRPHDAVCAIYRAKQLVVGGDPKQLPPTDFFTRTGDEADEEAPDDSGTAGFESLLNVCLALGLCRKRLRWHYRSRREGLIAFSNRHFYDGALVTFPSADEAAARAVQLVRVEGAAFNDGVNAVEARKVAALVMEHARATPDKSLGVIAFSQRQQDRILDELEVLRRQSKDCEDFFSAERADPFFVKNLENVQGDERDHIMLSIGYGPDAAGKVMMRFGPLNRTGGERRLNVAVTRARFAMTVVSSMTAGDIDLSRTSAEGAKLLKAFLDYAERGPVALAAALTEANERGADSPFEQEVGDELARRGLTVHRQVGCGGYRIDLAITDGQSGRYLLGVECDGASYHSAATARDRDRLRQSVLESLGWRLVRVWSTDWVRNRAAQVAKVLDALEAAKKPLLASAKPQAAVKPAPQSVKEPKAKVIEYESIEKVPEGAIEQALVGALTEYGSMPADDLISAASKKLGFKRVGPNIRERLATALNALVTAGKLALTSDDRVRVHI
jgi:very-short-patch-repair endonuclease